MYAIIETGGKQYKVQEGDVIQVERLSGDTSAFENVLALGGDTPTFGAPFVKGASVSYDIIGEGKTKKIIVFKMKRRKSYRRKQGHRQIFTTVKITGITA